MDATGSQLPAGSSALRATLADAGVALGLAALCLLLYLLTLQARQYGDAPLLISVFGLNPDGDLGWSHALYFPLAKALRDAWAGATPAQALRALSYAPAALAVGLTFLLARGWGAARLPALAAALLLALSPGWWFFATTIEVHALHTAAVALCACAVLAAPWRRPLAAALIAAALLPLLFLSHQSGLLLGPGLVLQVQYARSRQGLAPFAPTRLIGVVGPLFLVGLLAAIPTGAVLAHEELEPFVRNSFETVRRHDHDVALASLWSGWLQPLFLLLPLALLGLLRDRPRGWGLAALLALLAPPIAFFVAWGLPERGGYALASGVFLAVLAARALPRSGARALAACALLIAAQAAFAWRELRAWDAPEWSQRMRARAAAVERLMPAQRGVLITFDDTLQFVAEVLPGVEEHHGYVMLENALAHGVDPEAFAANLGRGLALQCAKPGNVVVVDLSHRTHAALRDPAARPYLDAVEAWMRAHCAVELQSDPRWELYRLAGCD